jgi:methyltransferase (TIGR00027 family)
MARTDNDTWDLASDVGATATMVAAARAVATRRPDRLINDPFAERLVQAVGIDFFTRLAGGELEPSDIDDNAVRGVQRMVDVMAVRTRYFDEFFALAARAGVRQAVILASGLDARAYRLRWPAGMTVFEVDQPQVMQFKTATLDELAATPTVDRRVVASDLRQDWPAALQQAGFNAAGPTAWIAEGLLGYLPPDAQDRLLDDITALSAKGSRLALDSVPPLPPADQDHFRQRILMLIQRWQNHGFNVDMTDMVYLDDHNDVAQSLATHEWETVSASASELFVANGLDPVNENDDDRAPFAIPVYITATLQACTSARP